jgi:hypothetical protein
MFGHDWVKHDGKIIDRRLKHATDTTAVHEYVVDVRPLGQPDAEPLMRVLVQEPHLDADWWSPVPGATVTVEVDGHGKVRFDRHDPRLSYKAVKHRNKDSFDATLHQPPGT